MGGMENKGKRYEDDADFLEFLGREFDCTAVDATVEELAEFAFGGIEEAIEAYESHKKDVV